MTVPRPNFPIYFHEYREVDFIHCLTRIAVGSPQRLEKARIGLSDRNWIPVSLSISGVEFERDSGHWLLTGTCQIGESFRKTYTDLTRIHTFKARFDPAALNMQGIIFPWYRQA